MRCSEQRCAALRKSRWGFVAAALAALPGAGAARAGERRAPQRLGAAPSSQQLSLVLPLNADVSGLERFANAGDDRRLAAVRRLPVDRHAWRGGSAPRPASARRCLHYLRRDRRHPREDRRDRAVRRRDDARLAWRSACSATSLARYRERPRDAVRRAGDGARGSRPL